MKTVNVRLHLPVKLHTKAKVTAAIQQQPLREFLVMQIKRGMLTFQPKKR